MLDVRQLWRALHGVPQLLLVQPEQLNYDLAYALAILPLVIAGIVFFLQDALLLFAISFLAGIVCLLALQLARLTFGLPAWVGFKATHPLVASVLIACFFSPRTPAWIAASMVILFILMDTILWPQLQRVMLHPALIVVGFLCGVAALSIALRSDVGFQLASGPSLFLAGYIAADRRRVLLPERFTFLFGVAAGVTTMILRWYGEGQQAAWQGLLLVSLVVT